MTEAQLAEILVAIVTVFAAAWSIRMVIRLVKDLF